MDLRSTLNLPDPNFTIPMKADLTHLEPKIQAEWDEQGIEALLCPATSTPALPLGGSEDFILGMTYTYVWNVMHFPGGVAPVTIVRSEEQEGRTVHDRFDKKAAVADRSSRGLPIGVQVVAKPYRETTVLGALGALERELQGTPGYPITPTVFP